MNEIEDWCDKNNTVPPNCAFCCLAILCSLIHILIREVVAENQGFFLTPCTSKGASVHAYTHTETALPSPHFLGTLHRSAARSNHATDDDCRGLGMILKITLSKALCKVYLLHVKHWQQC